MVQSVLNQASSCGCVYKCDPFGNCKILPPQKTARWELQQIKDRWLLVIGGVPQANLYPEEAEAFLKRRCPRHLNREAV